MKCIMKNNKIKKSKVIIILVLVVVIIINTGFNRNNKTGLIFRSILCPDKTYEVTLLNNKTFELKLPEGSVYTCKDLNYIYYNKKDFTECKYYFDKELARMKTDNKIVNYTYYDSKMLYKINVDNKYIFYIFISKNTKVYKYAITDNAGVDMFENTK